MSTYHYQNLNELNDLQINSILELQSLWVKPAPSHFQQPNNDTANGFLISKIDSNELSNILQTGGNLILALNSNKELRGYILSTQITEFTDLYKDTNQGDFNSKLEKNPIQPKWRYLYQMVVHPNEQKTGLAHEMLQHYFSLQQDCVLTDVLTHPISNDRSIRFFLNNQFEEYGLLTLLNYREFGELKSKVLLWTPKTKSP